MSWIETPVMVLDFETTSRSACTTRPVQIGFAIFDPWSRSLENEKNDIVNSGVRSTPGALKVHGITDARAVKEGVPIKEAFGSLVETINKNSDYPIMMYNAPFDFTILNQECKRHGLQLPTLNVLDPLVWAQKFCPAPHKLGVMAERFGIPHANAHDALADVRTTIDVALSITQDNSTLGTASIKELQTLQKEWSRGSWPARLCTQPSPINSEDMASKPDPEYPNYRPGSTSSSEMTVNLLERLSKLRESGAITDIEFEEQKRVILEASNSVPNIQSSRIKDSVNDAPTSESLSQAEADEDEKARALINIGKGWDLHQAAQENSVWVARLLLVIE